MSDDGVERDGGTAAPRLRSVEAFPVEHEGQSMIALRDPAGWTDSVLVMTPEALFVASCFDGTNSIRDVQVAASRRFGQIVPSAAVLQVAEALDQALLLDTPRFHRRREALAEEFLAAPVRPATHAGGAYEDEPERLRGRLDHLLDSAAPPPLPSGRISGLLAPHIDLDRGGDGYGAAYRALRERGLPEIVVVLGTVHAAPPEPYTATRKAFATPLGDVPICVEFVDALARRYGPRLFAHEVAHRGEHSIEFQAVWLRHLLGAGALRIVPILCSSFHEHVEAQRPPSADPRIADFVGALRETLEAFPEACLIAAADLAHLGPRFGDAADVTDETAGWCRERDGVTMRAAAARDASGFFTAIAEEGDARRVCGISAIYTFLEALPRGSSGTLLHYGQALDEERSTFVSFASMAFQVTERSPEPPART